MSWNNQDDKTYRGSIDRQYVSKDEDYEVHYFVTAYLEKRNLKADDKAFDQLKIAVKNSPLTAPILRNNLENYLGAYCKRVFNI